MIVKLSTPPPPSALSAVLSALARQGYGPSASSCPSVPLPWAWATALETRSQSARWRVWFGQERVLSAPCWQPSRRPPLEPEVPLGAFMIGGEAIAIMAGPCSVEDRDQIQTCARFVAAYGATALRGGAFKPRTSPYSFQGLGHEALEMLADAGRATGLPVVTEVMEPSEVESMAPSRTVFQVGARSMQNFPLLREVGRSGKPVLLKRGPSSTVKEFILAAEYILLEGNPNVILCERGIRTFETATRNTLDLDAVPVLKAQTHLPVMVDPSHGTGRRDAVIPMARAAVAAGADGRYGRSASRSGPGALGRRPVPYPCAIPNARRRNPPRGRGCGPKGRRSPTSPPLAKPNPKAAAGEPAGAWENRDIADCGLRIADLEKADKAGSLEEWRRAHVKCRTSKVECRM